MTTHFFLELLGYAGSGLITISLMLSSVLRLRVLNLRGGAAFSLYGLLIGAYPVAILNGFLVVINACHIARLVRAERSGFRRCLG